MTRNNADFENGRVPVCPECNEPLDNHVSEGKHGANQLLPWIQASLGEGEASPEIISAINNVDKTKKVNLGNRAELKRHLESVSGHGLIDDVGAGSVDHRDAYDHIAHEIPEIDWDSKKEKLSTPELRILHDWLHKNGNIPHLTNGDEHYHLEY